MPKHWSKKFKFCATKVKHWLSETSDLAEESTVFRTKRSENKGFGSPADRKKSNKWTVLEEFSPKKDVRQKAKILHTVQGPEKQTFRYELKKSLQCSVLTAPIEQIYVILPAPLWYHNVPFVATLKPESFPYSSFEVATKFLTYCKVQPQGISENLKAFCNQLFLLNFQPREMYSWRQMNVRRTLRWRTFFYGGFLQAKLLNGDFWRHFRPVHLTEIVEVLLRTSKHFNFKRYFRAASISHLSLPWHIESICGHTILFLDAEDSGGHLPMINRFKMAPWKRRGILKSFFRDIFPRCTVFKRTPERGGRFLTSFPWRRDF